MADGRVFVEKSKVAAAVEKRTPLLLEACTVKGPMERLMNDTLVEFLKALRMESMSSYLLYCENELLANASKANAKRVYFAEKNLNICDKDDYAKGMEMFRCETLGAAAHYDRLQEEAGLRIRLVLCARDGRFVMEVRNNVAMSPFEEERICERISRANGCKSIEDAVAGVLDESEGAGIGLVTMVLMLKKFGMAEDGFRISCEGGETCASVSIPISRGGLCEEEIVAEEFETIIKNLPQFPKNILRLQKLCGEPNADLLAISSCISRDVALSGELLKQVNSAAVGLVEPCGSIRDAVKFFGIRGIKNMLYSLASIQTFRTVSESSEHIWHHARKVAFFSNALVRALLPGNRAASEDAFTGGLLHDMGKIIFEMARPQFLSQVRALCERRGVSQEIFERLSAGMNHGEIGAHIAEHWNFPKILVDIIHYHHSPKDAPEESRKLSCIIYLADLIAHCDSGAEIGQPDSDVLSELKIAGQAQFQRLSEKLLAGFEASSGGGQPY